MAGTVCIFMPDAIDSLSSLGLWILLYLAYNPDVQKKCQAEVSIDKEHAEKLCLFILGIDLQLG